ncbi:hypothetical protein PHYC_03870 [Phycisphaerales bacterium]|nr:hypothetical protein PHYC_03870 [Phycisphaerales bacterium]
MGPSEKAFNQVKNILGKLDRSIDNLRQQRTTPTPALVAPTNAETLRIVPAPAPPPRSNSAFGRATPIRQN